MGVEFFQTLEKAILDRWRAREFDHFALPEVAAETMRELPPSEHVRPIDLLRWVQSSNQLPPQFDPQGTFGQPPITVSSPGRIIIQALFWVDGTTSIHQHSFSGAFHVMSGSSIHAEYGFQAHDRVNAHLQLGDVTFKAAELLTKGDVRPILPGQRFIHALFHLERPSVSIVVRSAADPEQGPQYTYQKPYVAYDPFARDMELTRRLQVLKLLNTTNDPDYRTFLDELLTKDTFATAFHTLHHCFDSGAQPDMFAELLAGAERRHGTRASMIRPIFEEINRQVYIIKRRKLVVRPDHRFLLALLLNLPGRTEILQMVARRYPELDPAETIARWVSEIAEIAGTDEFSPNPLGMVLQTPAVSVLRDILTESRAPADRSRAPSTVSGDSSALSFEAASQSLASCRLLERLFVNA